MNDLLSIPMSYVVKERTLQAITQDPEQIIQAIKNSSDILQFDQIENTVRPILQPRTNKVIITNIKSVDQNSFRQLLIDKFIQSEFYNFDIAFQRDRCKVTFYKDQDGIQFVQDSKQMKINSYIEPEHTYLSLVQSVQGQSQYNYGQMHQMPISYSYQQQYHSYTPNQHYGINPYMYGAQHQFNQQQQYDIPPHYDQPHFMAPSQRNNYDLNAQNVIIKQSQPDISKEVTQQYNQEQQINQIEDIISQPPRDQQSIDPLSPIKNATIMYSKDKLIKMFVKIKEQKQIHINPQIQYLDPFRFPIIVKQSVLNLEQICATKVQEKKYIANQSSYLSQKQRR